MYHVQGHPTGMACQPPRGFGGSQQHTLAAEGAGDLKMYRQKGFTADGIFTGLHSWPRFDMAVF